MFYMIFSYLSAQNSHIKVDAIVQTLFNQQLLHE